MAVNVETKASRCEIEAVARKSLAHQGIVEDRTAVATGLFRNEQPPPAGLGDLVISLIGESAVHIAFADVIKTDLFLHQLVDRVAPENLFFVQEIHGFAPVTVADGVNRSFRTSRLNSHAMTVSPR